METSHGEFRISGDRIQVKAFGVGMIKNFFTQRVMNLWNAILQKTVEARPLTTFTREINNSGHIKHGERVGKQ